MGQLFIMLSIIGMLSVVMSNVVVLNVVMPSVVVPLIPPTHPQKQKPNSILKVYVFEQGTVFFLS